MCANASDSDHGFGIQLKPYPLRYLRRYRYLTPLSVKAAHPNLMSRFLNFNTVTDDKIPDVFLESIVVTCQKHHPIGVNPLTKPTPNVTHYNKKTGSIDHETGILY